LAGALKKEAHLASEKGLEIKVLYYSSQSNGRGSQIKDLEEVFECAVDLTIDGSREMSKILIYTVSFEELKEEMGPVE
jgi:hypothetical protein